MRAISELFGETRVVQLLRPSSAPPDLLPIDGNNLSVLALSEPTAYGWIRKLEVWRYLPIIWQEVQRSDAVHTPVPGDLGTIGLLVALLQRKPLFVRHCGTWGTRDTMAQRFLAWLLPRITSDRNIVMATGGGEMPPEPGNPDIRWIFSTSLTEEELNTIPPASSWSHGKPLRLISVGRLSEGKNMQAIIRALPDIQSVHPNTTLSILGEGEYRAALEGLVDELDLVDSVTLWGNVSHAEVLQHLSKAHIFVFPTRTKEGFPKAVLEALAAGLPVVATSVSVLPYLLNQGRGYILPSTSPLAIAQAVLELLEDERHLQEMSAMAREVSHDYTLEKWGSTIGQRLEDAWGPLRECDNH